MHTLPVAGTLPRPAEGGNGLKRAAAIRRTRLACVQPRRSLGGSLIVRAASAGREAIHTLKGGSAFALTP